MAKPVVIKSVKHLQDYYEKREAVSALVYSTCFIFDQDKENKKIYSFLQDRN